MIRCGKRLQRHRRHHQINHMILVMLCGNRYAFQMKTYQKYCIFITKYLRLMRQKKMMLKDKQSEKEINNLSVRFERISWALSIASLMCSKNSFCVIVFFIPNLCFRTSVWTNFHLKSSLQRTQTMEKTNHSILKICGAIQKIVWRRLKVPLLSLICAMLHCTI